MITDYWIFFLAIFSIFAAMVSSIAGMGGGILLLLVMNLIMPLSDVIPVHGVVLLLGNITGVFLLRKFVNLRLLLIFTPGVILGSIVSGHVVNANFPEIVPLSILCLLIIYTVFKPNKLPHLKLPPWAFLILGCVTGFLAPIIGVTGPILAPFLLRPDFSTKETIANRMAFSIILHLFKIPIFLNSGFDYQKWSVVILILSVAIALGTKFGILLLHKIKTDTFKLMYKSTLLVSLMRIVYKLLI